jgi:hypothetical protein
MSNPPSLTPDTLQELADKLENRARQLDLEARDLKKRAKVFRAAAAKIRGLERSSTLDPVDSEVDEL